MHRYAVVGKVGVEDWAKHTALWYTSVQCVEESWLFNLKGCGLLVRKSNVQLQREGLMSRPVSLEISFDGIMVLKAELKSAN